MEKKYDIEVGEGTEASPFKIGDLKCPNPKIIRIVHISDTHLRHNEFMENNLIPSGDILVHSGDFTQYCLHKRWDSHREFNKDISEINNFFGKLPHKHKLFIAGNHEVSLSYHRAEKIQQRLTNAILLEDKSFTLEGIKFYGAPWNNWRFWAFSRAYGLGADELGKKWQLVPEDTDIMVTHNPPYGILDSGRKKFWHATSEPAAHLFGHLHGCNGMEQHGSVLFSNAAMAVARRAHVIDFYLNSDTSEPMSEM